MTATHAHLNGGGAQAPSPNRLVLPKPAKRLASPDRYEHRVDRHLWNVAEKAAKESYRGYEGLRGALDKMTMDVLEAVMLQMPITPAEFEGLRRGTLKVVPVVAVPV